MKNIRLIWVGKTQEPYLRSGIKEYMHKLSHYIKIDLDVIKPARYSSGNVKKWRKLETEKMIKTLDASELNIFLDQKGERNSSRDLAKYFENQISSGIYRVNFFIGGAYGIDKSILPLGIKYLSLSEMTFTHQMVRLFLLEQIYRAFTIIRGQPYHNF
ncbi:MAG: ribosomal RNA large subunit methyltransferase H [Deltaproteobacteria bacterium]|nr:ribosomal RNA large subunit methyltransferase H [Deltaproteobacteria bacterium]|tara:strand:+ start:639 stop:1112 length:474 start_codon:yes stop_codon:yes gene_type:complete